MILRRYTNANGDQQEISLSQEDWEKVTEESLEMLLGFKKAPAPKAEPAAEEAPAAEKATAKSKK
jgi:hypothetical protein